MDYAFGTSLEKDTTEVVKADGGTVLGAVRVPLATADFSSFLMQAQASKAQVLGLALGGNDLINLIKTANEFGIQKTMKLAAMMVFINDINALGLKQTQGMYLTDGWYWDQSPESRQWARRYFDKMKKMPSMFQAADASAVLTYAKAVKTAGSTDADKVMAQFAKRADQRLLRQGWRDPSRRTHGARHVPDAGQDTCGVDRAPGTTTS